MKDIPSDALFQFRAPRTLFDSLRRLGRAARLRSMWVAAIRTLVRMRHGGIHHIYISRNVQAKAASLRQHGHVQLGNLLTSEHCGQVRDYLQSKPLLTADAGPGGGEYGLRDVLFAPYLLVLANSSALIGLATAVLGCKPTIARLSVMWAAPRAAHEPERGAMRRAPDDWRHVKVFVHLSEPDELPGPPLPACGTAFAVDTAKARLGSAPRLSARLMVQIQYSIYACPARHYERIEHPDAHRFDGYTNRLFFLRCKRRPLRIVL
ncbi:MAG: hypothetical protein V4508_07155 [Pseudomonadota bacterium]